MDTNENKELIEKIYQLEFENQRLQNELHMKQSRGAGRKKKIKDELADEIMERYSTKVSINKIANDLKLSRTTIRNYLVESGLKEKKKKAISEEEICKAINSLISNFDEISSATYNTGSPVPKNFDEVIKYYDFDNLVGIIEIVKIRYKNLDDFLKYEKVVIMEPLRNFF